MNIWKLAANLAHLALNGQDDDDTDPAGYEAQQFDAWHDCMEAKIKAHQSMTNYEKCDTIRKEAIASILDQFKQGKTLVRSEQAYIQNGDSGWDWVGRISADGNDITEQNLSFHTYDTIGDEEDAEHEAKDIWSHIDDISTDCLCAVADNLYA